MTQNGAIPQPIVHAYENALVEPVAQRLNVNPGQCRREKLAKKIFETKLPL
jgi:hypothetical protein